MAITGKTIEELNSSNFLSSITGSEIVPAYIRGTGTTTFQLKAIKDYLENSNNDYISILDDSGEQYRLYMKNGELVKIKESAFSGRTPSEGENTLYDGLIINQMYGAGTDASTITPVSHSFIELYNFRDEEVNLKGLYLWYRAKSGKWQSLELQGIIPAKHSFLIRCAKQMDPYHDSVTVPILDYDMEWNIKLSNQGFSVYLCIGSETPEDNPLRNTLDSDGNIASTNGRYIDLLGAGGKNEDETIWAYETRYLHCMDKNTGIHRIDYANSGNKNIGSNALVKQNNEADCEAIDYTNCDVSKYRPRSLKDGRWTEFYDKVTQSETSPGIINISFGEEDTSRCFCFRTPVAREGFVYYRKSGDSLWNSEFTTMNIVKDMEGVSTVHKAKISNLTTGVYEYKVGYDGCWSDIATFEIKEYNQNEEINMLWTSDQQSWTEREYDVWKVAAQHLRQNNGYKNYDFHLNTGDISQNGNRSWEWRLYYNYSGELVRNIPHMITAGNNDLVSKMFSDAYENYIYEDNKFANSVYAYDLGYTHFICLNSNTDYTYVTNTGTIGGYNDTDGFLQAQMEWFDEHIQEVNNRDTKPRWVIVYAHLSPFTVGRTKRLQRWVSHFEKWNIDLVLCGHNHAYSRSIALKTGYDYDQSPAYNDYVTKLSSGSSELKIVDEYQADGVTEIDRTEHISDGVVYILNHACGFKLSGKEKPIILPSSLQGTKHSNSDGAPWWIAKQKLPTNPCYATLKISYDKIEYKFYEIEGIIKYDQYKNTILNEDLSKISDSLFDQLTINYSDRNK